MKLVQELLASFAIAAVSLVVLVIAAVRFVRWLERSVYVSRSKSAVAAFKLFHEDEWDLVSDGTVIASLVPSGPPEDPNTSFIIFDIAAVRVHESEVESLLHQFNRRDPDDERVCFRSRTRAGVLLKDSQVIGALMEGGKQFNMKAYPAETTP
jgi:hypothetical protein